MRRLNVKECIRRWWKLAILAVALIAVACAAVIGLTTMPDGKLQALSGSAVFSGLDALGRAGDAMVILSRDTLDIGNRQSISNLSPSGYQATKYDFIEGGYLWNRCHLIGAQLTPDTEVAENLITGTRQLNLAMLPIENRAAEYVRKTGRHVIYRVSPDFRDDELVCRGVTIQAYSVEGGGFRLSEYIENVQDGVTIDYATGFSWKEGDAPPTVEAKAAPTYILNTRTLRFHLPTCPGAADIAEKNRQEYTGSRETLIGQGYKPCGTCNP